MFYNYLKIAIRSVVRDKYFAVTNILGLSIGIAASLLIFSYIHHELSYDTQHHDVDQLYRVDQTAIWNPGGGVMGSTGPALGLALQSDYPEIEKVLRVNTMGEQVIRVEKGDEIVAFNEPAVLAADSSFFEFFYFPLLEGDAGTALRGKNKVVLSNESAKRLFGNESALGKTILMGEERIPLEVTGVTAQQADNLHFNFDYLVSLYSNSNIKKFEWSYIWTQVVTYIKLSRDTDASSFQSKIQAITENHVKPMFTWMGGDFNDFVGDKGGWNFYLQPVTGIHLYAAHSHNRLGQSSDIKYIYIFGAVGLFVLSLAIINFINLSTARGANRAKEVGVKKVLGAHRKTLMIQFQMESFIFTSVAVVLGLSFMEILRLFVSNFLDVPFSLSIWHTGLGWSIPFITIAIAVMAGTYPSLYLTKFRPAAILKGRISRGFRQSGMRNALVMVQFVVSIAFIAATIIVYQQLRYFNEKDHGFNREQVLVVNHADKLGTKLEPFRNEVSKLRHVQAVSITMAVPGRGHFEDIFMREGDETKFPLAQIKIDPYYLDVLDLQIIEGRNFDPKRPSDKRSVLLNETTVKLFGWSVADAIGKKVYYSSEIPSAEVIGVVKDFHFHSLKEDMAPLIFLHNESNFWGDDRVVAIRTDATNRDDLVSQLESSWKTFAGDIPFELFSLDDDWRNHYKAEERVGGLFAMFTGLSIVIAMIGLFGLVAYSSEQRKKEIGIRKVMGASVVQLVLLLNGNFTRLMLVAFVIAVPLVLYTMHDWLSQFSYKINIGAGVFAISFCLMLLITWITVSYQSLKAALTNPTDVLKEE